MDTGRVLTASMHGKIVSRRISLDYGKTILSFLSMPSSPFLDLPVETLEKALNLRKEIEVLKDSLAGIMESGGSSVGNGIIPRHRGRPSKAVFTESAADKVDGRKGKRSAATRARMAAAQKARWAAKSGEASAVSPEPTVKALRKKRTMSPEARAKIAAAQRARWAARKS